MVRPRRPPIDDQPWHQHRVGPIGPAGVKRRLQASGTGPDDAREYTMRFVRVPELAAEPVRQRYEPLGNRVVRYSSGSYQADITFDVDGFVTLYQDYLERVG